MKSCTATAANPSKRAKRTLEASRVTRRASLGRQKRAASAASTKKAEEEAAPEVLRGTEGETALNISSDMSLATSPPQPPPTLDLTNPSVKQCDCSFDCEDDFQLWEDGVRLNTLKPPWQRVFYVMPGCCRFCRKPMEKREDDDIGECLECEQLSEFECVKKFAPRWCCPRD